MFQFRLFAGALALSLTACNAISALETCPTGSVDLHGSCFVRCAATADCLSSETCDTAQSVCMPTNAPVQAVTIEAFDTSAQSVPPGTTVELSYKVTGATQVEIAPGLLSRTPALDGKVTTPALDTTTTYTLTAHSNGGATTTRDVTITVTPVGAMVQILFFNASQVAVKPTDSITLSWEVVGGTSVEIKDESDRLLHSSTSLRGTFDLVPGSTNEYELIAYGSMGEMDSEYIVVNVNEPPDTLSFRANPPQLQPGQQTSLRWSVDGATRLSVHDGAGAEVFKTTDPSMLEDGDVSVTPDHSQDYELRVSNQFGTVSTRTHVAINFPTGGPRIDMFDVNPKRFVTSSVNVNLTWDVVDATSIALLANGQPVAGMPQINGSFSMIISETTVFELIAEDRNGGKTSAFSMSQALINEVEPNDDRANAQPLYGTGVSASIATANDADWYRVDVPDSGFLVVHTGDVNSPCAIDTYIEIFRETDPNPFVVDDDGGEGLCSTADPFTHPQLSGLTAGAYYIKVWALGGATGPYTLEVMAETARCGDGQLQPGEMCDDGNTTGGDGCSPACNQEGGPVPAGTAYRMTAEGAAYFDFVGTQVTSFTSVVSGHSPYDEGYVTIPLPFGFDFYGTTYSQVSVSTNGFISFETPDRDWLDATPLRFPDPNGANAMIAPFWGQLELRPVHGQPSDIRYTTMNNVGGTGQSAFAIQFRNLTNVGSDTHDYVRLNAQVYLLDDGTIAVHYGMQEQSGSPTVSTGAGIENASGTDGFSIAPCNVNCSPGFGGLPENTRIILSPG